MQDACCLVLGAGACVRVGGGGDTSGWEVKAGTGLGETQGFAACAIGDAGPYPGKVGCCSGATERSRRVHSRLPQ